MWEVFSNGQEPYPGLSNEEVRRGVGLRGERMAPPPNTTEQSRKMMCRCWNANPDRRPSFSQLRKDLEKDTAKSV